MLEYQGHTLEYWKNNASEDYIKTPISVLRYINCLEQTLKDLTMKIYSIDPATQARLGQYHCFIVVANSKEEAISLIKTEGQKWLLENVSEEGTYTGEETEPFVLSSDFFGS